MCKEAEITPRQKAKIIRQYLERHLKWIDKCCLEWSRAAMSRDEYAVKQYRHFKAFQSNLRHLIHLAGKPKAKAMPRMPNMGD